VKRKTAAIILVTVIALSVAGWFVHNQISELLSQNSDLQHQMNELQDQNDELQAQNGELQDENDELQQQLDLLQKRINFEPEVRITEFSSRGGWMNVVGMTIAISIDITISNIGISDIEGLTLEIKRLGVDDEDPYNITRNLSILHAKEKTEIPVGLIEDWDVYFDEFHNRTLEATLKLGDVILDVQYLSPRQYL
jgi:FtsZ-binding cell division protein ZapB